MRPDDDLHVVIERNEKTQQVLDRELLEIIPQHLRLPIALNFQRLWLGEVLNCGLYRSPLGWGI